MSYFKYPSATVVLISLLVSISITGCQSDVGSDQKSDPSNATVETVNVNTIAWSMTSTSGKVSIDLSCKIAPFVGDFQQCDVQLKYLEQPRYADAIVIDGGMKAHGHGLPTVPVLSPTAKKGHYKIDGLKYSMPGAWIVGFKVSIDGLTEQVIFDFTI